MTVIALCRNYIAADSLHMWHEYRRQRLKLVVQNGFVYSACGVAALRDPMISWFEAGATPNDMPALYKDELHSELVVVDRDGCASKYTTCQPYRMRLEPPHAFGCMDDFAMGAMAAGADAVEAVRLCCAYGTNVCGPVQYVDLRHADRVVKTLEGASWS